MDSIFQGNIQVVEADIEPLMSTSHDRLTDEDDDWNNFEGNMMGQSQGSEPLHENGMDKQYGATTTTTTSPKPRTRIGSEHGSGGKSPVGVARYDSRNNNDATCTNDDGDDDAILVLDGSEQFRGNLETPTREDSTEEERIDGGENSVTDGDAIATATNEAASEEVTIVHKSVEDRLRCGWCGYSPPFVQIFNNPKGYLFFACTLALFQSMTAFGLVYISITTLEHRFSLDSFQSSFISSSYDVSALSVSLFVTYLGERGNKPRWIGIGSAIFSLGSIVFALPHFLTGPYVAGESKDPLCQPENGTRSSNCDDGDGSDADLAFYYWVFITAQVLHGIGGSPLLTLGVTYMDENLHANDFGLYFGIFNAVNSAGPALGYVLGGVYLKVYADFHATDSASVSPNNPTWVGAWWLGFLVNGSLLFFISLLMLGYPKSLPGSKDFASSRKSEVQRGQEFETGQGFKKRLRAFPRAVLNLITNVPFLCICFFNVCVWFFGSGVSVFGPKYLESQMNISSSNAAFYFGILTMVGSVTGALLGGYIIKKLDLNFKGLILFAMVCILGGLGSSCGFLLKCPNVPMAGVTVAYQNSSEKLNMDPNITATCNMECSCAKSFDPVCGSDDVLYYSACYAGCSEQWEQDGTMYLDCSCISNSSGPGLGTAESGKCSIFCSSTRPFFMVLFLLLTFGGMVQVPVATATMRCVPHSQRAFALGLQTLMYSALGTIPGPVVLGLLIDKSCLIWEESCDGSKTCWMYQNSDLSTVFLSIGLAADTAALLSLLGALLSYRTPDGRGGDDGKYNRLENEDITDGV